MDSPYLNTPIEFLKGVGPKKAELLQKELKIYSFKDLLQHYPFRYIDKTQIYNINEIQADTAAIQIKGKLGALKEIQNGPKKTRLHASFSDSTGTVEIVWFAGIKWVKQMLMPGREYLLFGKASKFNGRINFSHPELTLIEEGFNLANAGFQAVYPSTEKLTRRGLDAKGIHKLVQQLLEGLQPSDIQEFYPTGFLKKYQLTDLETAYRKIHNPSNIEEAKAAEKRLKFDEFFFIQLRLARQKSKRKVQFVGFKFPTVGDYFNQFYKEILPFELTNAQKRVLKEIRYDLGSGKHMNRLIQGDVGSGKTIVALMCMLLAKDNGFQACLMAPTEILARQHYAGISEEVAELGLNVQILTGSVKGKTRKLLLEELKEGKIDILIGTHALLEDPVIFENLGLVVIDEQHRFGVAQRARLWKKNTQPPHVLVMTATPIPRTLAMTVYGDLDVSVIDELPPGRKPITTSHRFDSNRLAVFGFLKKEILKGRQAYIVYPLIQESAKMDLKDLEDGYESICRAFPDFRISVVHGRMKAADKDFEMQRFVKNETQIMVATTVIEVGVNVPNASIMIIENAERFGLSQLHQLRGRVGRGAEKSFCVLMSSNKLSKEGKKRLRTMVATQNGFEIAEVDMEIRGPGDIQGTRQSGLLSLKLADPVQDKALLEVARYAAVELLENDPGLNLPENSSMKSQLMQFYKHQGFRWENIS